MAPPRQPREPEPLSSEEVTAISDLLSRGIPDADAASPMRGAGGRGLEPIVLRYDLVANADRGRDDLPGLQLVHERYAAEVANELRRAVGSDGAVYAEPVLYGKFADLYARMRAPTVVAIVTVEGVGCSAMLSMEPVLAMCFIDLWMGGDGAATPLRHDFATRGLTDVEKGIVRHLVAIISRALAFAFRDFAEVSLELVRVATDPRHAAVFEPGEAMAELVVNVEQGPVVGAIHLALPTSFLAQFDAVLSRVAPPSRPAKAEAGSVDVMRAHLGPIVVNVSAILGTAEMTLERLLSLVPGDVVRLDADPGKPLTVLVEGRDKMRGFPLTQHGNLAVRIEEFNTEGDGPRGERDGQPHRS